MVIGTTKTNLKALYNILEDEVHGVIGDVSIWIDINNIFCLRMIEHEEEIKGGV